MNRLTLQDQLRASSVDRWQIVRTLRQQNLAEHQWNVTMIAIKIAEVVLEERFTEFRELRLMRYTLTHDLTEIMMGDICTPVKQRIKEAYGGDIFKQLDAEICDDCHRHAMNVADTVLQNIAKLADLIDGVNFLTLEGHGDHSKAVLNKLKIIVVDYTALCNDDYDDYNWSAVPTLINDLLDPEVGYLKFESAIFR